MDGGAVSRARVVRWGPACGTPMGCPAYLHKRLGELYRSRYLRLVQDTLHRDLESGGGVGRKKGPGARDGPWMGATLPSPPGHPNRHTRCPPDQPPRPPPFRLRARCMCAWGFAPACVCVCRLKRGEGVGESGPSQRARGLAQHGRAAPYHILHNLKGVDERVHVPLCPHTSHTGRLALGSGHGARAQGVKWRRQGLWVGCLVGMSRR